MPFTETMDQDLGFSDLNIPVCPETAGCLKQLVLRAFELGYRTVALNTVVDQVVLAFYSCFWLSANFSVYIYVVH